MSYSAPRRSVDTFASPSSATPNQYPFPFTSPTQSSLSSRQGQPRGLPASSYSSAGGVWIRQHKIKTAASSAVKPPSTKDIPPVTLSDIPPVDLSVFSSYLKQAGALYDAFQRAKGDATTGEAAVERRRSRGLSSESLHPTLNSPQHSRRRSGIPGTPALDLSPSLPTSPLERPHARRQATGRRRAPLQPAPLSTIPNVYFEPDFHLENPRIFDIVSERSEIVRQPGANGAAVPPGSSGRKVLATNAILQEKLSWYMDTVEVHLISSISTASSSFFAALGNLRELHTEAASSVAKIQSLRSDLTNLDGGMMQGGLKIVALRRRRENMRKLGDAIRQLWEMVESVTRCEEYLEKGEVQDALSTLVSVECLMAGQRRETGDNRSDVHRLKSEQLIDLRGINALQGSDDEIAYLRQKIGKTFESRFLDALLGDLRRHVDSTIPKTTLERWDNAYQRSRGMHGRKPSIFPTYLHMDDTLRSTLQVNLDGLARCDCLKQATTAYRDALWREIKVLIKRHLPSSSDDDMESTISASTQGGRRLTQQEKSSLLARHLRDLAPEEAEDMLQKIYANVGEALRRLSTQVKLVLDITSTFSASSRGASASLGSPSLPNTDVSKNLAVAQLPPRVSFDQEDIQQTLDMSNLLGQGVDIAQAQITKVLKVRSEQSTQLPLRLFLRYFNLNRLFADECEATSGRGGTALKTVVNAHIQDFVKRASDAARQKLIDNLDRDRWDAKDFSEEHNEMLTDIITASTRDVGRWSVGSLVFAENLEEQDSRQSPNGYLPNGAEQTVKDRIRSAIIDEQKFILPDSALVLLEGISQFEQIITGIPSMTQELTTSLLEYLKLFNSRSSQLILGAGATRSAGLKNITTKHLALASQTLSFVTALVPYMREFVRRYQTNPQGLMIEFDKVKRLYQEHQSGISDKMVDIMSNRASTHVSAMKKIDWDGPSTNAAVSPYMETLIKETTTLHKVLSKHLPQMTIQSIMDPVFNSYREQWHHAFDEIEVKTEAGKERILRDLDFFNSRMSKLDGAGDIGRDVVDLVKSKPVSNGKPSLESQTEAGPPIPNGTIDLPKDGLQDGRA
ncbi:uncharacterized protein KY384_005383 [Bacidia gigantensis]|uniref:uncharacterized protein n=1 Tax=Bacidia gigantensis TaxID=2732470 RepID=UPI001D04811A|nr:uncharacterized protein KY384_005383 [Bacidia gigantensis]KAG8529902.1 hypothetical protein KY384_005383 [Bacidia gigantensis]